MKEHFVMVPSGMLNYCYAIVSIFLTVKCPLYSSFLSALPSSVVILAEMLCRRSCRQFTLNAARDYARCVLVPTTRIVASNQRKLPNRRPRSADTKTASSPSSSFIPLSYAPRHQSSCFTIKSIDTAFISSL